MPAIYPVFPDADHFTIAATPEQRANLAKLAAYLRTLPTTYERFNMSHVFQVGMRAATDESDATFGQEVAPLDNHFQEHINECGTVACAIGHGPLAGVKVAEEDYSWRDYSTRAFGSFYSSFGAGSFMFSGDWTGVDNTALGAARRIEYVLQHGAPGEYWYSRDDMTGWLADHDK